MSISIKTEEEIGVLREGGKRLAFVLRELINMTKPGVSGAELDTAARKLIEEKGDILAFLNYTPSDAKRPFPASVCVSINDEIVHGIPNEEPKIIQGGDIVSLDLGLIHQGLVTDTAYTVAVGDVDETARRMLEVNKEALRRGVEAAQPGNHIGDIGHAIESYVSEQGFSIFRELVGHGVGYELHEDPYIPNFGKKGKGARVKKGMVFAIEPMIGEGSSDIVLADDGYTYKTKDGSRASQFEHTVAITEKGPEILTQMPR